MLDIIIASDPDHDEVYAEIWDESKSHLLMMVFHGTVPQQYKVKTFSAPDDLFISLAELRAAIEMATFRLSSQ
jgi:hypothetical protein